MYGFVQRKYSIVTTSDTNGYCMQKNRNLEVKHDGDVVQYGSDVDEEMPSHVVVSEAFQSIEDCADGIADASRSDVSDKG